MTSFFAAEGETIHPSQAFWWCLWEKMTVESQYGPGPFDWRTASSNRLSRSWTFPFSPSATVYILEVCDIALDTEITFVVLCQGFESNIFNLCMSFMYSELTKDQTELNWKVTRVSDCCSIIAPLINEWLTLTCLCSIKGIYSSTQL